MRFERMPLLRYLCGREWDGVRRDFLEGLASPRHRAAAKVRCCIATR